MLGPRPPRRRASRSAARAPARSCGPTTPSCRPGRTPSSPPSWCPPGDSRPDRDTDTTEAPDDRARPTGDDRTPAPATVRGGVAGPAEPTWIFPFDEPLAPDEGDTQALAVNTTDDTAAYDVAFALVWADGDEPVDNTNEAYALASCDNCAAVAVAFQVVLVVGDADVAVPQNISVAVNYDCTSCLTYSLAVQLFVTLDGPLSEDAMAALEELWQEIAAYGAAIGQVPLDEIQAQLTDYEQQILAIIEEDQGPLTEPGDTTSEAPSDDASPTSPVESPSESGTTPSESPAPSGSTSPSPSSSTSTSTSPAATPSTTPSPSSTPTPTPTSSPSATESTEPTSSPTSTP